MNSLAESPVVEDLLSLTRALLHLGDSIAWLAILRAPWSGLTLADLLTLSGERGKRVIFELLHSTERVAALTPDGRTRLARVIPILDEALAQRGRLPVRRWIESVWMSLGGPACLLEPSGIVDAGAYFAVLDEFDAAGDIEDLPGLQARIAELYSSPDPEAGDALQLLTMHKAKGLEFDNVIIPSLGRAPRGDSARVISAVEMPVGVLLAPVREAGDDGDHLAKFVAHIESQKSRLEEARLLYVASTRARKHLHLIGQVKLSEQTGAILDPPRNTLLSHLWPTMRGRFEELAGQVTEIKTDTGEHRPVLLRRLPASWQVPAPPGPPVAFPTAEAEEPDGAEQFSYLWAGDVLRHIGTAVHSTFELIGREGVQHWDDARIAAAGPYWRTVLTALGVPAGELADAVRRVGRAVSQTLADERGRWVLGVHAESASELALTGIIEGQVQHVKIDRTFVDELGTRWIIDFKTAAHEGADVEAFLDAEKLRYEEQLRTYAALMAEFDERPIRVGLYFPLLTGWREWAFKRAAQMGLF